MKKKVVMVIMDGWGLAKPDKYNAIDNAKTPNIDKLIREYPNTRLKSDGEAVGLPEGQFGTSEVNHMTIGAGRVIFQDLPKISKSIKDGDFFHNKGFLNAVSHSEKNHSSLHIIGILSDGGIHTTVEHVFAMLELLDRVKFKENIYFHVFTDGRDTPPQSATTYLGALEDQIANFKDLKIKIATIQGRFYLDRDRDWAKTDTAVNLIVDGKGTKVKSWEEVVNIEYGKNINDEFFSQYILDSEGRVQSNDAIIFTHYRTDRLYQLVKGIHAKKLENLKTLTLINVSDEFEGIDIAFPREKIEGTLAEVISDAKLKQLHITETEKFAHLTFFLNGEREKELPKEKWEMLQSNRYVKPFYNFEPSMRNFDITKGIIKGIEENYDFIISNLSSPDMVGHTGNYEAAIISAESVDYCVGKIFEALEGKLDEYALIITADHGNSDIMWDYQNDQPHTQHTTSPVPFILITEGEYKLDRSESLADVAPTILNLMGLKQPKEMTGKTLIL